jgi:hypothetical protein
MAPPDQGSGATPTPEAAGAAALKTTEMPCTCGREDPMPQHHHERTLSSNTSFSSPTASPALSYASSSTNYLPASNKLSCESIPYAGSGPDDLIKLSSFSSTSSYESFFHIEALDDSDFGPGIGDADAAAAAADNNEFLDFEPCTTRPPAVQTMMPPQQGRQKPEGAAATAAAYDPKRLPSSMFRTRSTNPAEWSATSNESLFSIQLSSSAADLTARYADFYYDAAGFPRFPSLGRDAAALRQLPSLSESSGRSGGLCVRHDCARCCSGSKTRKSVRFAATESVSGEGMHKHPVVVSTYVTQPPNRSFA